MGGRDTRNSSLAVLWLRHLRRKTYADDTNLGLDSTELFSFACCMSCAFILPHSTNQILPDSWRSRQRYKSSHLPKHAFAPRGSLEMYEIAPVRPKWEKGARGTRLNCLYATTKLRWGYFKSVSRGNRGAYA